jgi:hypothetical protein
MKNLFSLSLLLLSLSTFAQTSDTDIGDDGPRTGDAQVYNCQSELLEHMKNTSKKAKKAETLMVATSPTLAGAFIFGSRATKLNQESKNLYFFERVLRNSHLSDKERAIELVNSEKESLVEVWKYERRYANRLRKDAKREPLKENEFTLNEFLAKKVSFYTVHNPEIAVLVDRLMTLSKKTVKKESLISYLSENRDSNYFCSGKLNYSNKHMKKLVEEISN